VIRTRDPQAGDGERQAGPNSAPCVQATITMLILTDTCLAYAGHDGSVVVLGDLPRRPPQWRKKTLASDSKVHLGKFGFGTCNLLDGDGTRKELAVTIGMGLHHFAVSTDNGDLQTLGTSQWGQTALDDYEANSFLGGRKELYSPMMQLVPTGHLVLQVACGDYHTIILTREQDVLCCGHNGAGQLGLTTQELNTRSWVHGPFTAELCPVHIGPGNKDPRSLSMPRSLPCAMVHACALHSFAVTCCGDLYMWGRVGPPVHPDGLDPVADIGPPVDAHGLFAPGPRRIDFGNPNVFVVYVSSSQVHMATVDADGLMYSWGSNVHGQLGTCLDTRRDMPVCVQATMPATMHMPAVKHAACGTRHTLAVSTCGQVWGWGDNSMGQLAFPRPDDDTWVDVNTGVQRNKSQLHLTWTKVSDWPWGDTEYARCADEQNVIPMTHVPRTLPVHDTGEGQTPQTKRSFVSTSASTAGCAAVCEDGRVRVWGRVWSKDLNKTKQDVVTREHSAAYWRRRDEAMHAQTVLDQRYQVHDLAAIKDLIPHHTAYPHMYPARVGLAGGLCRDKALALCMGAHSRLGGGDGLYSGQQCTPPCEQLWHRMLARGWKQGKPRGKKQWQQAYVWLCEQGSVMRAFNTDLLRKIVHMSRWEPPVGAGSEVSLMMLLGYGLGQRSER